MYLYFLTFTLPKKKTNRSYHVSEVCTKGASGLVIFHHTVVVEDFSTAFTTKAKQSFWKVFNTFTVTVAVDPFNK